jgi:hypothetical protein
MKDSHSFAPGSIPGYCTFCQNFFQKKYHSSFCFAVRSNEVGKETQPMLKCSIYLGAVLETPSGTSVDQTQCKENGEEGGTRIFRRTREINGIERTITGTGQTS